MKRLETDVIHVVSILSLSLPELDIQLHLDARQALSRRLRVTRNLLLIALQPNDPIVMLLTVPGASPIAGILCVILFIAQLSRLFKRLHREFRK
jgi:hypothetical protein